MVQDHGVHPFRMTCERCHPTARGLHVTSTAKNLSDGDVRADDGMDRLEGTDSCVSVYRYMSISVCLHPMIDKKECSLRVDYFSIVLTGQHGTAGRSGKYLVH